MHTGICFKIYRARDYITSLKCQQNSKTFHDVIYI